MGKSRSETESNSKPWGKYQPFLVGQGDLPAWLVQPNPTQLSPELTDYVNSLASGQEGSWLQTPPIEGGFVYPTNAPYPNVVPTTYEKQRMPAPFNPFEGLFGQGDNGKPRTIFDIFGGE